MLKRTYALGLLAAATLGCFLTCSQASQVEVNKQTAPQNAAAVGHGNAVFQDQGSYQNQWITQVQVIHPSWNTPDANF